MVHSNITNKTYDQARAAYITNMKQAYLYLRNGAVLLDILYMNTKTGVLVFVFEKNDTLRELYDLWNNHESRQIALEHYPSA